MPPCTLPYFRFTDLLGPYETCKNLDRPWGLLGFLASSACWDSVPSLSFQKKFFYNNSQRPFLMLPGLIQTMGSELLYLLSQLQAALVPLRFSFSIRKIGILKAASWMSLNPINDLHKGSSTGTAHNYLSNSFKDNLFSLPTQHK